jgi:di/tricarboxylate transporter
VQEDRGFHSNRLSGYNNRFSNEKFNLTSPESDYVDSQITLLLAIIGVALVLFSTERLPADVIALGVMLTLILTGLLSTEDAFLGFGSDTVMMILGLLLLTAALERTGVVELAGRSIFRYTGDNPNRVLAVIMIASASLGAFMSNTASTAFFVPLVIGIAHRARISASRLLMPLAFASILTSSVTLISTSTNLVVSGLMQRYRLAPLGVFELSPVGIPIAIAGLVYMYTLGRRLLPDRTPVEGNGDQAVRAYLTEIMILPDSVLVGKTLDESGLGRDLDIKVLRVVREKKLYFAPRADLVLQEGDVLLVEGERDEILKVKDIRGIDIKADVKLSDPELAEEDLHLAEVILMPRSPLIGRTLKGFRFRERYGLQVLAVNRHGETLRRKISQIRLQLGDILLIQGERENIALLEQSNVFNILGAVEGKRPNLRRARTAVAIFVGSLLLASFNVLSLPVAVLFGALLAFLTRCITPEEAYRSIEWKAVILIGCMLALGIAMDHTGTADFLAGQIVRVLGGSSPLLLLTGFFILTVLLTQPMSNQAAAVVVIPIALRTATQLNLDPRTFAAMIAVAASCSYLTPLEPSCLMVYGPGRYRFADFLKVGSLLTVIIYIIAIILVPLIWPPTA